MQPRISSPRLETRASKNLQPDNARSRSNGDAVGDRETQRTRFAGPHKLSMEMKSYSASTTVRKEDKPEGKKRIGLTIGHPDHLSCGHVFLLYCIHACSLRAARPNRSTSRRPRCAPIQCLFSGIPVTFGERDVIRMAGW